MEDDYKEFNIPLFILGQLVLASFFGWLLFKFFF